MICGGQTIVKFCFIIYKLFYYLQITNLSTPEGLEDLLGLDGNPNEKLTNSAGIIGLKNIPQKDARIRLRVSDQNVPSVYSTLSQ